MVLGCSVCNQPLVIRPNNVGYQDPNSLMTKYRSKKHKDTNESTTTTSDITDAEIVATKCGHMFHLCCIKTYLQRDSQPKLIKTKPQGCPTCHKPVIQSQLWPIIIRATREELLQIDKIKKLKFKNAELVTAIQELRNNTQEKNAALQEARKRMFDYRVQLQGMDVESLSLENLEKLEQKQVHLDVMLSAVNEQNLVLTALVERESVYGQKLRSKQTNNDFDSVDPLARIVKQMTSVRVRKEGLVEKSSLIARYESHSNSDFGTVESSPKAAPDALERWRQMKSSLAQNGQEKDVVQQYVQGHPRHQLQKCINVKSIDMDSIQMPSRPNPHSGRRNKSPSAKRMFANKIADWEASSGNWKTKSEIDSNTNNNPNNIYITTDEQRGNMQLPD